MKIHRLAALAAMLVAALVAAALPAAAHVSPNIELVKRGEFVRQSLPGADRFFEKKLLLAPADERALERATRWIPSEEDARLYVGRDAQGRALGTVIFVWMPSEHGPVGVGVVFDPAGKIQRAEVTDVASEPLAWVRPLLAAGGMSAFSGLTLEATPAAAKVAPAVTGAMSRYYAKVIAGAVARAQALERISLATGR